MPEKKSETDRYLAEVDRLLGVRGRERRWALALVRRRLSGLIAAELKKGADVVTAEKHSLGTMGSPEHVVATIEERASIRRSRQDAQIVLTGFVLIALGIAAVATKVFEIRRFHTNTDINIQYGNFARYWRNFYRPNSILELTLPPRYLSFKLVLGAALLLGAVLFSELAIGLARRRRLSAALTVTAASLLIATVTLQIALAFEWHRLRQGKGDWLLAATLIEVGAVLLVAVFLVRPARALLNGRLSPLASVWLIGLVAFAPLLAASAKSGLSSTTICSVTHYYEFCPTPVEQVVATSAGHEVEVSVRPAPAGASGAVALEGRRLAFAGLVWKKDQSNAYAPSAGPTEIEVWQAHWAVDQGGPCGRWPGWSHDDPLAGRTAGGCGFLQTDTWVGMKPHDRVPWRNVASFRAANKGAIALTYAPSGRLALAFSRSGGIWVAEAPAWRARRLLTMSATALRLASSDDGALLLAAVVPVPDGGRLMLLRKKNDQWQPIDQQEVAARSELELVAKGFQVDLLYRDRLSRLVLEQRNPKLSLLNRRFFLGNSVGAIGALRGDEIGLALTRPPAGGKTLLSIYRMRKGGMILSSVERLKLPAGEQGEAVRLLGVVQTGRVVRALFGPAKSYHPSGHVLYSFWALAGTGFVADWPRWAVVSERPMEAMSQGRKASWSQPAVIVGQPPARQLERTRG